MKEKYKLTIEPITCVHVGSGEKLTPLDYFIASNPKTQKNFYIKYSSDEILMRYATNPKVMAEFEEATSNGMKEVLNFFVKYRDIKLDEEYRCGTTKEFVKKYKENRTKDPLQNASEVMQQYRPAGSKNPVIPGSSIKGSIRTAVLNYILLKEMEDSSYNNLKSFADKKKKDDFRKNGGYASEIENRALEILKDDKENNAQKDPFRCVEISDAEFTAKDQLVGLMKNISTDTRTDELKPIKKLQMIAEVVPGFLTNAYSPKTEANLRINESLQKGNPAIHKKISADYIIKACNFFYKRIFKNEYEKFYRDASEHTDRIVKLKSEFGNLKENQFILRVGRWSQVEFVTFGNDFRNPVTPKDKKTGEPKSYGETRIVFDYDGDYLPLGWCKCTLTKAGE